MLFNVACSTDEKYVQHCMAMLCSLFENNRNHQVVVHLMHGGLSCESKNLFSELCLRYCNIVRFYEVGESYFEKAKIADYHPDLSVATYYRLLLPIILDVSIERVLYLDCDVIVLGELQYLFDLNLDGYGVAAVMDTPPCNDEHRRILEFSLDDSTFCAGVLVVNLDYWRNNKSHSNMLQYASAMGDRLFMEDQDVLNHEFRGHWFKLPYKYGYTPMSIARLDEHQTWSDYREYAFSPLIIHYAAHPKPWLDIAIPGDKYYWQYLKMSGYPYLNKTKASKTNREKIIKAKIRYYINFYIHPFVPNFLEMIFMDVLSMSCLILSLCSLRKIKEYRLKMWINKYLNNRRC